MLSATIVAVSSAHLLIKEIEIHHPSLYNDIGHPKLFVRRRFRDQCRFNLFILLRKYVLSFKQESKMARRSHFLVQRHQLDPFHLPTLLQIQRVSKCRWSLNCEGV